MNEVKMQQIIVSGVGGQGVLFITKLLAETALEQGYSVLISETHGMAQRGGNVISHLKIADGGSGEGMSSPLVRPGKADVLLALHPDAIKAHGFYLKPDGTVISNVPDSTEKHSLNASRIAEDLGAPIAANLVLLGFAVGSGALFCGAEQLEATLQRLGGKRLELSLKAFRTGAGEAAKSRG
jgi:indolepyruvate ferredoxin oxidoreductase, beta subunit